MFNKSIIKVYNGTNHKVAIYNLDNENFVTSRSNLCNVLTSPAKSPDIEFCQKNTLDIKKISYNDVLIDNIKYLFPDNLSIPDPFYGYTDYDVILVSRMFAETAKNNIAYCQQYPDFVDRLYVLGTKVQNKDKKILGNSDIQKATFPYQIEYYISHYAKGEKPSLISAQMALYCHQMCGLPKDNNWEALKHYVCQEITNRQSAQKVSVQTFNV